MHLEVSGVLGTGFIEVATVHKGQRLTWSTRTYSKVKLNDPNQVFSEINAWLTTLPMDAQDQIWTNYVNIRNLFNMDFEMDHIVNSLVHYIGQLYKQINLNHMRRWLLTIGNLNIPVDTQKTITGDSRYSKRDQTYLENDYINLATVSMALRLMIPIWGEFIDQGTDDDLYKENDAVALIYGTELANWPLLEKDVMGDDVDTVAEKLDKYVKFCVNAEPITLGRLWAGMSSTGIIVHLQSKIMVRRLTIIPLSTPTSHSLVSNIFMYVKTNLNPAERSTADRVNAKRADNAGGDEDDKTSFIEAHKTKSRVNPGDIVAFDDDAQDYMLMIEKVDPTFDMDKLKKCIDCIDLVSNHEIRPHQTLIAKWVMAKAFPAKAYEHLEKLSVNYLLATTQALLWHWGYTEVAIFMQVAPLYHGEHQSINQLNQTRSGSRIASKYKPDLDILFPFMKRGKVPQNGSEPPKPDNYAGIAINNCNQSIRSSNWQYYGPDELFIEAKQVATNKVLVIPQNIKHSITEVVIHLANINR